MCEILTVLGTRPEIIRLSKVILKLNEIYGDDHKVVYTGQNSTKELKNIFIDELNLPQPDYDNSYNGTATFSDTLTAIFNTVENAIRIEKPKKMLILGDTNSALSSIIAKRYGVKVYHMEAGNRCYDDTVPEEVNRRVVDTTSDIHLPYTERSRMNLIKEGYNHNNIYVTGNPIWEVIKPYVTPNVDESGVGVFSRLYDTIGNIYNKYGVCSVNGCRDYVGACQMFRKNYILVTLHRSENVDDKIILSNIIRSIEYVAKKENIPVVLSAHPRFRDKIAEHKIKTGDRIYMFELFSLSESIELEKYARFVMSDSGTVQEECCILKTPTITLRDVTERPETIECGSNIIGGRNIRSISNAYTILKSRMKYDSRVLKEWEVPDGYMSEMVSDTVINILQSV